MFTTVEKFNLITWAFLLLSSAILIFTCFQWFRKKRIPLFNKLAIIVVFIGTVAIADAYWIEPNWLQTEQVVIHDPELAQVLEGVRVVQISDIHLQGGIGYRERDLIAKVNALKPDLLFITGDFFSDKQKSEMAIEVSALTELIRSFRTTTGIFGVTGNYDYPLNNPAIMSEFRAAGIDILINENRALSLPNNKILYIAGFHYAWNRRPKSKTFSGIPLGAPIVLLAHEPDHFGETIGAQVNLLLVGHTHGGQIRIPFLTERSKSAQKSAFMSGLYDKGKTKMYVNRGIGTTRVPVRFFCRPEITVLTVTK
ncbi:MAG: metallophosphoesterase [Syntrophaceae bacterium]|nr:metallophosphoesterase [Syntrophaceae bacterium]